MRMRSRKKKQQSNSQISIQPQFQQKPFAPPSQTDQAADLPTHQERLQQPGFNFADIPIFAPNQSANFQPIQPKLTIGAPGDKYEQEADRVADQVVNKINTPEHHPIQREVEPEDEDKVQPKLEDNQIQKMPMVQRAGDGGETAVPNLESSINQQRGKGNSLPEKVKQPLEGAFGADFSGVKIHTDAKSDQLNRSIQAKAFTTGKDVFFKQGEYNPSSQDGLKLVAHELTHVVQQNGNQINRKSEGVGQKVDQHRTATISPTSEKTVQRTIIDQDGSTDIWSTKIEPDMGVLEQSMRMKIHKLQASDTIIEVNSLDDLVAKINTGRYDHLTRLKKKQYVFQTMWNYYTETKRTIERKLANNQKIGPGLLRQLEDVNNWAIEDNVESIIPKIADLKQKIAAKGNAPKVDEAASTPETSMQLIAEDPHFADAINFAQETDIDQAIKNLTQEEDVAPLTEQHSADDQEIDESPQQIALKRVATEPNFAASLEHGMQGNRARPNADNLAALSSGNFIPRKWARDSDGKQQWLDFMRLAKRHKDDLFDRPEIINQLYAKYQEGIANVETRQESKAHRFKVWLGKQRNKMRGNLPGYLVEVLLIAPIKGIKTSIDSFIERWHQFKTDISAGGFNFDGVQNIFGLFADLVGTITKIAGTLALITGLIGLIPCLQPLLGFAAIMGSIAMFGTFINFAISTLQFVFNTIAGCFALVTGNNKLKSQAWGGMKDAGKGMLKNSIAFFTFGLLDILPDIGFDWQKPAIAKDLPTARVEKGVSSDPSAKGSELGLRGGVEDFEERSMRNTLNEFWALVFQKSPQKQNLVEQARERLGGLRTNLPKDQNNLQQNIKLRKDNKVKVNDKVKRGEVLDVVEDLDNLIPSDQQDQATTTDAQLATIELNTVTGNVPLEIEEVFGSKR